MMEEICASLARKGGDKKAVFVWATRSSEQPGGRCFTPGAHVEHINNVSAL